MVDPGVSNERTALAWQRTGLSILASAAIVARLTWSELGVLAAVLLGGSVLLSGWVFWESRARYAHDAGTQARAGARGGRAPAAIVAAFALIAMAELTALLAA